MEYVSNIIHSKIGPVMQVSGTAHENQFKSGMHQ